MAFDIVASLVFSLFTSLREVLEAALIIGIVLGYLSRVNRPDLRKQVWLGTIFAIIGSIIMAMIFLVLLEGVEQYQELFEGLVMLAATAVLTWMILWMFKESVRVRSELEEKIDRAITTQQTQGIFLLVFFAVFREGAELVLFLGSQLSIAFGSGELFLGTLVVSLGFALGLVLSGTMALLLFRYTVKLNLRSFFKITSIILIVFAAGLLAHGIHELHEAMVIPTIPAGTTGYNGEIFNISAYHPEKGNLLDLSFIGSFLESLLSPVFGPFPDGRFEKSIIGSFLAGLVGWNDNPSLIEAFAYIGYYIVVAFAWRSVKIASSMTTQVTAKAK